VWKGGKSKNAATLEDWAFLGDGLLELWQATGETHWLLGAIDFADQILSRFSEPGEATLRFSDKSCNDLFAQVAPLNDNATPSGNGVAARLFAKLWHLKGNDSYRARAEGIVSACGDAVARFPRAYSSLLDAWRILSPNVLLVHLNGSPTDSDYQNMLALLHRGPLTPDLLVLGGGTELPQALAKGFAGEHPGGAKSAAWVCRGTECLPAAHSAAELGALLT
jgi:uncharacterized protein YyaL (SSP411 family)